MSITPGSAVSAGARWISGNVGGTINVNVPLKVEKRNNNYVVTFWDHNGNVNSVITYTAGGTQTARTVTGASKTTSSFTTSAATSDVGMTFHYVVDNEL
jgi:hypothetical protein